MTNLTEFAFVLMLLTLSLLTLSVCVLVWRTSTAIIRSLERQVKAQEAQPENEAPSKNTLSGYKPDDLADFAKGYVAAVAWTPEEKVADKMPVIPKQRVCPKCEAPLPTTPSASIADDTGTSYLIFRCGRCGHDTRLQD